MKSTIGLSLILIGFTTAVLAPGCSEENCREGLSAFCTSSGIGSGSSSSGSGPVCGDGLTAAADADAGVAAEACDDGNTMSGDGCSAVCTIEPGYMCTGEPSNCVSTCGNSTLDNGESCDDGNTTAGDGCDAGCQLEECYQASAILGDPLPVPKNAGEDCATALDGLYCNGFGACVDHCMDNAQTEDETGVDCGGATCTNKCLGDSCDGSNGANCPGGATQCVDGVCCDAVCDTNCFACNLPGKVGQCMAMASGNTDMNSSANCPVGQTCGPGASCTTKKANGQTCNVGSECASAECVGPVGMKVCKQTIGTPCTVGTECASGNCTGNLCLPP